LTKGYGSIILILTSKGKKGSEVMPSKYEIIQMINRQFSHSPRETIEEVNELIEDINNDPKAFTYELAQEIEEFSEKLNLCPLCGCDIIQIGKDYESSEYLGQTVKETIIRYSCDSSSCGYIKS
jgi:hypothetical protein